ncbi:MAG: TetR/AcrR family transcriptional regulator [Trebonia sp.]
MLGGNEAAEFTTRNVAALSGVAPSLCHYYFHDRTDLIIAVIQDIRSDWIIPLEAAVAPPGGFDDRAERVIQMLAQPEAGDLARLHSALHWFALNDERIRVSLHSEYDRWATCFVSLFETLTAERGDGFDPRLLGHTLAATADGLAAVQALHSQVDAETMLRTLIRRLVTAAASTPT